VEQLAHLVVWDNFTLPFWASTHDDLMREVVVKEWTEGAKEQGGNQASRKGKNWT
jgi:hypothetical protein